MRLRLTSEEMNTTVVETVCTDELNISRNAHQREPRVFEAPIRNSYHVMDASLVHTDVAHKK
jgi:hypothetical protein